MIYKAIIMSRKIEVMRDSGSEISLKKNVFEELEIDTITLKDSDLIVTQANRQKMELSGMVNLPNEVRVIKTWSNLYIVPDHDIGQRLVKEKLINFNPNQLKLKGVKIPLGINTSWEFDIYSLDNIKFPPPTTVSSTAK